MKKGFKQIFKRILATAFVLVITMTFTGYEPFDVHAKELVW